MDINALGKLCDLKEKGLLTQEEFEKQKKALLNNETDNNAPARNKQGVNWKNVGMSFIITLIYFFMFSLIAAYCLGLDEANMTKEQARSIAAAFGSVSGVIMAILSFGVKSGKYKNCSSWWVNLIVIYLLYSSGGGIGVSLGVWAVLYQIFQIRQGNVVLKGKN